MTDEMIEAVARAIAQVYGRQRVYDKTDRWHDSRGHCVQREDNRRAASAAIAAHKESLAKAGLGIRPREATQEMANAGWSALAIAAGDPQAASWSIWQAMWDKYLDKKPAVRIAKPPLRQRQSLR